MKKTVFTVLLAMISFAGQFAHGALPQDTYLWTKRTPAGAGVTKYWSAVAMSSDGMKLVACAYSASTGSPDYAYTSADGGANWTKRGPAGTGIAKYWTSAAMSSDGTKIAVCADYVYTSINSGITWSKRTPAGAGVFKNWSSLAMNANGAKIVACAYNDKYIYISTDGGASWSKREPVPGVAKDWISTAMSADGSKIVVCAQTAGAGEADYAYYSTNGGTNWSKLEPAGAGVPVLWVSAAICFDGTSTKIALCTEGDFFVYTSNDSGTTWDMRDPSAGAYSWGSAVAMNSTGTKLVACSSNSDYIFSSSDFGANWVQSTPNGVGDYKSWYSVAMSSDGAKIATCAHDLDYVYTANNYKQIQFNAGADGDVIGNLSQSVPQGMDCTAVTANPDPNFHFVNWTGDGGFVTTSTNPLTVANVNDSMTITANFARNHGTISIETAGTGTVTPAPGVYNTNEAFEITAVADPGFTFVNFTVYGDATISSTGTPSNLTLNGLDGCTATLTANFIDNLNERAPVLNTPESVAGLNGISGSSTVYKVTVPSGTTRMIISTTGGAGGEDCDIYVSPNVVPTLESYFARSTENSTVESITVLNPEITDWYILVYAYGSYTGVSLNISMQDDVPEKPTLNTASQDQAGKVSLTWSDCSLSGAVSYDIFRCKDNSPDLAVFLKNVAGTSTDDTATLAGTHYYYWVKSRSGDGDDKTSDFSNSMQGWPLENATSTIKLSNGSTVAGITGLPGTTKRYKITVPATLAPAAVLLEIRTSGGTGDCDLSVEKDGVILKYGVKATNNETVWIENPAAGDYIISLYANTKYAALSLYAKYYNVKPLAVYAPIASDGAYESSITVTWAPSAGAVSYEVWRGTTAISSASAKIAEVSDTSYVDASNANNLLNKNLTYYYWVKAKNGAGTSAFSIYNNSGYISRIPPAPGYMTASKLLYFNKIRLTWPAVIGATSYRIYRGTTNTFDELNLIHTTQYVSSTTTYIYDDMGAADPKPNVKYYYWIKSANGNGVSTLFKTDNGTIKSAGPVGVTASDGTFFDKVKITWTAVPGAAEYEVYSSATNDKNTATLIIPASPITTAYYYDEGVVGTNFYWVKAKYTYPGPGSYTSDFSLSNSGYSKITAVTAVPAPVMKSVSIGTYDVVKIAWNEVPFATSYTVYRRILAVDPWVALPPATNITALNHEDDAPVALQKYMYCVKAFNDAKESIYSSYLTGYKADGSTEFHKGDLPVAETGGYKSERIYQINVPSGKSRLVVKVEGGTGDCDLYAKFGSYPTTTVYNARGIEVVAGNKDTVTVANPAAGTWYILLYGATSPGGYANVQFSATYYGATDIVLTAVPLDDQTAPFTATFKGKVLDETNTGIAGLTVGVRDPVTALTKWLVKTDYYGNFTYSTKINADGEYTFDFYLTTIPDSTMSIGSWTVKTRRNPKEPNGFFDFSGYLPGSLIPVSTIQAQAGTLTPVEALAGLEEYMNTRRGFADGPAPAASTYEEIWLTSTLAAASADTKITSKLDSGLYMLFYGTEGAAVGNGLAAVPTAPVAVPGLVASPILVRVSPASLSAVIINLQANGLIDNTLVEDIANGGIGVAVVTAVNNPDELGADFDYDISLNAQEQLELLAKIAGDDEVELNIVTPERKYGNDTVAKFIDVTLGGGARKIGVAVTSFIEKSSPVP
ncbi:MAG TPA: hypothetical protein DCZ94_14335 [Lentisphaeria bacterium]|nr:MAG: hypothetical protein A2X48_01700 [Lentisphaerae bacterium GWF2_49_21]HBC88125.1 hypothetical protein [Lentisphaeria bacterium]